MFRGGFDSLVLLVSWEVWKERNRRTFDNVCSTPAQLVVAIRDEDLAWVAVGFSAAGCAASRGAAAAVLSAL